MSNKTVAEIRARDDKTFRPVYAVSLALASLGALVLLLLLIRWWQGFDAAASPGQLTVAAAGNGKDALVSVPLLVLGVIAVVLIAAVLILGYRYLVSYRFAAEFARRATEVAEFNHARLLDFVELSSDWMWETDAEHRFTLISSGFRSVANMAPDPFIGLSPWALPGDETDEAVWRDLRRKLVRHEPFAVLVARRDLSDRLRHLEFTGKPQFDEHGFVGYRGVGRDLTERINAETELRDSETRYRTLIESFFDWYWEQDAQYRFTRLLTSPQNPLALSEPDLLGRTRWDGSDADTPEWRSHIDTLREHLPFDDFVYRRPLADGSHAWFSVTGRPTFDEAGRFTGYRGVARDVSREHETRQALVDSEARYRTTFELAPVGIVNTGPSGHLESVNLAFASLLGRQRAELIGKHMSELTHPADQAVDAAMFEALREGRVDSYRRERRYIHASGREIWTSIAVSALRDEDGHLKACIGIILDISARVRAEHERQAVEERYRRLVDVSPDGILVHRDDRIVFANRAAVAIFGVATHEALLGQTLSGFYTDPPRHESTPRAPLEPGTTMPLAQHRLQRDNGLIGDVEITSVVIGFDDGPAVLSVVRDVSERIAAQNALQQSRARYQDVVESINEVIFQTDMEGRFRFLNGAWASATGFAIDTSIGRPVTDFAHPDDRPLIRSRLDAVLHEREDACVCEVRMRTTTGELRWMETHARLMRDPSGAPGGVMGSLDDITARKVAELTLKNINKELEARVRARTAELEASNRELEAFSYSVSHDLRAPLRAIDGFSVILQEDLDDRLDGTTRTYLKRIRSATARMAQLIDDLIELARLTRQPLRRQNIDLSHLVSEVVEEIRSTDPSRRLETDITPGLTINADPTLMRVAIENLVRNAWKFSATRPVARIAFYATRVNDRITFCIEDNGVGFDMAYAGKLFVPFYRLHPHSQFEGSGIGLATVARIIQRHGGEISAEAAPGEGARFQFSMGH